MKASLAVVAADSEIVRRVETATTPPLGEATVVRVPTTPTPHERHAARFLALSLGVPAWVTTLVPNASGVFLVPPPPAPELGSPAWREHAKGRKSRKAWIRRVAPDFDNDIASILLQPRSRRRR